MSNASLSCALKSFIGCFLVKVVGIRDASLKCIMYYIFLMYYLYYQLLI